MAHRRRSIRDALRSHSIRRALNDLVGCPAGGWPETQQAIRRIVNELPHRAERTYVVGDLIERAMRLDHADRYQWRDETSNEVAS